MVAIKPHDGVTTLIWQALRPVLLSLSDLVLDIPQAPAHLAGLCAAMVLMGVVSLRELFQVCNHLYK
jgi:hypothetical protein